MTHVLYVAGRNHSHFPKASIALQQVLGSMRWWRPQSGQPIADLAVPSDFAPAEPAAEYEGSPMVAAISRLSQMHPCCVGIMAITGQLHRS
jgi:hypothetical protein